jgi:hypothetical protein
MQAMAKKHQEEKKSLEKMPGEQATISSWRRSKSTWKTSWSAS